MNHLLWKVRCSWTEEIFTKHCTVKVSRLAKAKADLQEDKDQLTVALDAKQLEIGMLKRRQSRRESVADTITTQQAKALATIHLPNITVETPLPRFSGLMQETTAKKQTTLAKPRRISFGQPLKEAPSQRIWRDIEKENTPPPAARLPRKRTALLA